MSLKIEFFLIKYICFFPFFVQTILVFFKIFFLIAFAFYSMNFVSNKRDYFFCESFLQELEKKIMKKNTFLLHNFICCLSSEYLFLLI